MAQNVFVQQLTVDTNSIFNSFNINHLKFTIMYKVTKQVINHIGNVQSNEFIAFISINHKAEFDSIIRSFHGRAKAENQAFIIRGRQDRVRYNLQKINILDCDKARINNVNYINDTVNRCNKYIDEINTVAKRSAKVNSKKDVNLRQYVNVKQYWLDNMYEYVQQNFDDDLLVY